MVGTYKSKDLDWNVNLEIFEGPLDLLLHLINHLEIDIYDIPISQITDQYLRFIHTTDVLKLEDGGKYIVMASTLMSIKSELLVPRNEASEDSESAFVDEGVDPRKRLTELLVEYQRFKDLSKKLSEKEVERLEYVSKPESDLTEFETFVPLRENEVSLSDLVSAMEQIFNEQDIRNPKVKWVESEEVSVSQRIQEIHFKLINQFKNTPTTFTYLLEVNNKMDRVASFLAILELVKTNIISVYQRSLNEEIKVRLVEGESDLDE